MNKEQRLIYRELASELDWLICDFCKFNTCYCEGESPCDCGEPSCKHTLGYRLEEQWGYGYGIEPGNDCWGFRPAYSIDFISDIVGICLVRGWDSVWWRHDKAGNLKVYQLQI